jgi:hypothetical protein
MSQLLGAMPQMPSQPEVTAPRRAACGVRYRLVRAFWGTVAVTVGMILVSNPTSYFMQYGPGWSMAALAGQIILGALFFGKGMLLYEQASFPPDMEALQDPVACWLQAKLEFLKKTFWPLWFLAILVLIFSPLLPAVFLPLVILRPFYVTATQGGSLFEEGRKTLHYLYAMGKGLLFLTLCSCLAMGSGGMVIIVALYRLWHHQPG